MRGMASGTASSVAFTPLQVSNSECQKVHTVKTPNKGHVGDNINSHALSLVERLSSSQRFKLYCYYRETEFSGPMNCPL